MTDAPDPNKVKVFMNVGVSWTFMQHLDHIADKRRMSKAQLVRDALEAAYPLDSDTRALTREAGATK